MIMQSYGSTSTKNQSLQITSPFARAQTQPPTLPPSSAACAMDSPNDYDKEEVEVHGAKMNWRQAGMQAGIKLKPLGIDPKP